VQYSSRKSGEKKRGFREKSSSRREKSGILLWLGDTIKTSGILVVAERIRDRWENCLGRLDRNHEWQK